MLLAPTRESVALLGDNPKSELTSVGFKSLFRVFADLRSRRRVSFSPEREAYLKENEAYNQLGVKARD